MIIDCHCHFFPDNLAPKVIPELSAKANINAYTNGTLNNTIELCDEQGIDKMILLSIATNPRQMNKVNDFAISSNHDRVIAFGSVHPDAQNATDELKRLHEEGIIGIKLHPEYQEFNPHEERLYPIYEQCSKLKMIISFHAGHDLGFESYRARPQDFATVINDFPDLKIILAHMGGFDAWDEVSEHIAGKNIYLDTSFISVHMKKEEALKIIKKHGTDKIIFGTDTPWDTPKQTREFIESLGLSDYELEKIYYKNAEILLNI